MPESAPQRTGWRRLLRRDVLLAALAALLLLAALGLYLVRASEDLRTFYHLP
jgi:hypothetical protein